MDMSGKNRKQDLEKNVSIPFVSGQNVRIHGCLNTVVESSNRPNNVLYFQHNELKVIIETALKKCLRAVTLILKSIKVIIHIVMFFLQRNIFLDTDNMLAELGSPLVFPHMSNVVNYRICWLDMDHRIIDDRMEKYGSLFIFISK